MTDLGAALRLELANAVGSADWHKALETVPRERFLGDAVFLPEKGRGDLWAPIRCGDMRGDDWLALAYANETWVTQVGGIMADDASGPVMGRPSSSSTLPGLVVRMLEAAEIGDGDKVLEIGTGTGYSTSLMCRRLGDDAVTSIEYDPAVAGRTREAVFGAGLAPRLVVGDGLDGYAANAPYDRLIATCAVRTIPVAWPRQVRPEGTITAPMRGWLGGVAFAHLTVDGDGTASGRFLEDDLSFMTARAHLPPALPPMIRGVGDVRGTEVDPSLLDDQAALWVAQLAVPQAQCVWGEAGTVFLIDVGTGSRAEIRPGRAGGWSACQHGPIRLWDAVEDALLTWREAGQPHQSAFGLTVTPERQWVWSGDPDGPCWRLPA